MSQRAHQIGLCLVAALLAALFLHWFIMQPTPLSPARHELNFWVDMFFRRDSASPALAVFLRLFLGLNATIGLAACGLAVMLALRLPGHAAARLLAWSLVGGCFAAGHLYFVTTHAEYRELLGWHPGSPLRLLLDALAWAAVLVSPLWLGRFFLRYPRVLLPEDWEAEGLRWRKEARAAVLAEGNWRRWLYPSALRRRLANDAGESRWFKFTSDADQARKGARLVALVQAPAMPWVLLAWALLCALLDWLGARSGASVPAALQVARMMVSLPLILMLTLAFEIASRSLHMYASGASPEDRRKVDWITSSFVVGSVLVVCAQIGGATAMLTLGNWLLARDIYIPMQVMMLGPVVLATQLMILGFVLALAASIFYRGAIDPKLAARRITVVGVLGTLFACAFVLVERTVAIKLVAYFGLSPDTGGLVAFAMVAATAAPIRLKAVAAINTLASRYLPLDSMVEGERRTLAVALSDLSGYTLLSSRDEKQAMLLAALLQRQAARVAGQHRGRVVKSMGDAVLFAFEDAAGASAALADLHRGFAAAAEQFGLLALPVHSGAHLGEVTVAADGDLYGQTVNIAARIQGSAQPGQIVASAAFAEAAGDIAFRDLGEREFKNVPGAIACRELLP